ncbi:MAG: hypothetical protein HY954_00715 [Deltaproteobacteria bacterium]|nr:hypothetical protein [Deltaproteobacteria bacterium]
MEFTLPDKSRVDCLTEEYAVEVDFASKWAEALGQALYYSIQTGKRPGILLILEDDKDKRFLERANSVAQRLGIRMWTASKAELEGLQR